MRYLKIPELKKGGYYNPSDWLLYAAFNCLVMQFNDPWFKNIGWFYNGSEETGDLGRHKREVRKAKKMFKLYYWWTVVRPARPAAYDEADSVVKDVPCPITSKEYSEVTADDLRRRSDFVKHREDYPEYWKWLEEQADLEDQYAAEDQAMLKRLVEIREMLWC